MNYYLEVLKKYAVFNGRARRKEYWYYVLVYAIIASVVMVLAPRLENIYTWAFFLPTLAVGVRRMHDVNKSGWFLLIPIYSLILACTDGTKGPNRFGEDPKMRPAEGAAVIPPANPAV